MNAKYLNIYNNLIKLTRNKNLYLNLVENETFSDRITFLLLHMSFFIKTYKENTDKLIIQQIHDFIFKQIELSIREMGYGDVSVNKNMKKYVNFFYAILNKVDKWNLIDTVEKCEILNNFINNSHNITFYTNYFDNLATFYKNNTLNYFTKDIEEPKF
tara:strand:- start:119 stop:592 length:474 start_codon:yes stop_codon:yes gene_type:complete